jgi:hypothetical protein
VHFLFLLLLQSCLLEDLKLLILELLGYLDELKLNLGLIVHLEGAIDLDLHSVLQIELLQILLSLSQLSSSVHLIKLKLILLFCQLLDDALKLLSLAFGHILSLE